MKIELSKIVTTAGTQMRGSISNDVVEEYQQAEFLPPVDVFRDPTEADERYYLADGFHRLEARLRNEAGDISAIVHEGTLRDAILYAAGANGDHGLRRSNEDKRRAVTTLLKDAEWARWTDREIARQCKVHHTFVGKIRSTIAEAACNERVYTTKHGTVAEMKTGNIGKLRSDSMDSDESDQWEQTCGDEARKVSAELNDRVKMRDDSLREDEQPLFYDPLAEDECSTEPEPIRESVVAEVRPVWELPSAESPLPEDQAVRYARASRAEARRLRQLAMDLQSETDKALDSEAGQFLQEVQQSLRTALDKFAGSLKAAEPYCVCFKCHGSGCVACKQFGWLNRSSHDSRRTDGPVTKI